MLFPLKHENIPKNVLKFKNVAENNYLYLKTYYKLIHFQNGILQKKVQMLQIFCPNYNDFV